MTTLVILLSNLSKILNPIVFVLLRKNTIEMDIIYQLLKRL
jgi:hypothetical protein